MLCIDTLLRIYGSQGNETVIRLQYGSIRSIRSVCICKAGAVVFVCRLFFLSGSGRTSQDRTVDLSESFFTAAVFV